MSNYPSVHAFFQATKVETAQAPYDTIHLKVYYPSQDSGEAVGMIPPNAEKAPFPVVIWFNGFNCSSEAYQWLAIDLAKRGIVVVTFAWVAENLPGMISLTPGVDISIWSPEKYGTAATASALPSILNKLETLQKEGLLAGLLDLEKVILGGHSAGGRVAIESASRDFFPQLAGAFSYAAHTAVGDNLGYEAGTILPLPDSLPLLLLGGSADGVIKNSGHRYGLEWEEATTPISRTFQEAVTGGRGDTYLLLLAGANHFCITDFDQSTTSTVSLDFSATQPATNFRSLMAHAIGLFIEAHICQRADQLPKLNELLHSENDLIQTVTCK